ncbi:hypothetical protein JCM8097_005474 [Rhodosporidiobolus ruineniae]
MTVTGKCNCGAIQVQIPAFPNKNALCCCTSCRASTGSIFSYNLVIPTSQITFLTGKFNQSAYEDTKTDTGHTAVRRFCKTCGSPISTIVKEAPEIAYLKGGLFPPHSLPAPSAELFTRNAESWQAQNGGEGVFRCEGNPPA